MEDLGGPDAVEDLDTEALAESLEQRRRQRLARRYREPDARQIEILPIPMAGEQHRIMGRHREEQRRTESFDSRVDLAGRHRARPEDRRRPHREGEVHAVAETVREVQLRDAQATIACDNPQDAPRVAFRAYQHVVLQVDARLRAARAAGGIQPERRGIAAGGLRR
jgi:hypothetical protein